MHRMFLAAIGCLLSALTTALGANGAAAIEAPEGFVVEKVHDVDPTTQGSWVSLCVDPLGRLYASDQYGGLWRITPPQGEGTTGTTLEKVDLPVGHAQGLCWAFDSLYAVIADNDYPSGAGLYRLLDSDGDDRLDTVRKLRKLRGEGEHGPHAIVPSPDGQSLFLVAGNGTFLTELSGSRVPLGADRGREIMGGWIARLSPDGDRWELIAKGLRNPYDAAFNRDGELFTYDADMELDLGAAWYRPTRVCHVVSGAEFGWRYADGKWPAWYPDSLPATIDIGTGSPTGVSFGYGTKFPAKYREALFICDWSYGRIFAVHLRGDGASYRAEKELFLTGAPLPATDLVINPHDGAMYFTTGGRRIASALYRVRYTGEATAKTVAAAPPLQALRRSLEALHHADAENAIERAWPQLGHADRFIRTAARIAVEHQPLAAWRSRALGEADPATAATAQLALVRRGSEADAEATLKAIARLDLPALPPVAQLQRVRTASLAVERLGELRPPATREVASSALAMFPNVDATLNDALSRLLAQLQPMGFAAKAVDQLEAAETQEQQTHWLKLLSTVRKGWNLELRKRYFGFYRRARGFSGGQQLEGFIANYFKASVLSLTPLERTALQSTLATAATAPPQEPQARPYVRNWSIDEALEAAGDLSGIDTARGQRLFAEARCAACHAFGGSGGAVGPNLTGLSGRFTLRDVVEAIVDPSKTVSDQYGHTIFTLDDGSQVIGRVANLSGSYLQVVTNQFAPGDYTKIETDRITSRMQSPVSPMMPGLLNTLDAAEVRDLLGFLMGR